MCVTFKPVKEKQSEKEMPTKSPKIARRKRKIKDQRLQPGVYNPLPKSGSPSDPQQSPPCGEAGFSSVWGEWKLKPYPNPFINRVPGETSSAWGQSLPSNHLVGIRYLLGSPGATLSLQLVEVYRSYVLKENKLILFLIGHSNFGTQASLNDFGVLETDL